MSTTNTALDISPMRYMNDAIACTATHHPLQALNYMDLAISLAFDKHDFILKKIELLYQFNLYGQCTDYIILHFSYLYHHCTLKHFARVLSYYVECTQCLTEELNHLLLSHNIPIVLSTTYKQLLSPDSPPFAQFAKESYGEHEYALCTQYATLAIKQDGASLDLYQLKAMAHELLGQLDEAISGYKHTLTLAASEELAPLHFSLGNVLQQSSHYLEAHFYYTQAIALSPDTLIYYTHDADCLFKWGKLASARQRFRLIIQLFPLDAYSYLRLGELYEISHHKRLSSYYYKQAQRLKNNKTPHMGLINKLLGI